MAQYNFRGSISQMQQWIKDNEEMAKVSEGTLVSRKMTEEELKKYNIKKK